MKKKKYFEIQRDKSGKVMIETPLSGYDLVYQPTLNKGSAFSKKERDTFRLHGILPPRVSTMKEQCKRIMDSIHHKSTPLGKYTELHRLQNRNETLFYRLIYEHMEELMPIIYTPTVGVACEMFSHIFTRTRGIWITPGDKGRINDILSNFKDYDIRLIVATDNESILGIGDQGAGGIAIAIGKIALYCIGAGIHPSQVLPVSLDMGTNNPDLLNDLLYVGWKQPRIKGKEYFEIMDEFVDAAHKSFPNVLIQWEDLKKQTAFDVLDRYKDKTLSFNDDIDGTAGVALAGILTACKIKNQTIADQKLMVIGAGCAGVGIARLFSKTLGYVVGAEKTLHLTALTDSHGLLSKDRNNIEPYKKDFIWTQKELDEYKITSKDQNDLLALIKKFQPTVLIGTSGQPNTITQEMVEAMCAYTERPIILPFSNPTELAEAKPEDVIKWSKGKALIATGSPFEPVSYEGKTYCIGQGNNVFIFPGVGLGSMLSNAKVVKPKMFYLAAKTLSESVSAKDLKQGMLYPPIRDLRFITQQVAKTIIKDAQPDLADDEIQDMIEKFMWVPEYPELIYKP
jgi:malate dehydrogenase (oxaloacetate-decarboxylating)